MGKRLSITNPEMSLSDIEQSYRQATDIIERTQWQVIWLLAKGKTTAEVSEIVGYSLEWVRCLARRFNREGSEGIGDGRHGNPGAKPLLDEWGQAQLMIALEGEPASGGKWTGAKVAEWMSEVLGRPVHPQRGWEYLKGLEYSIKVPRPVHSKADEQAQQEWKKKLSSRSKP